MTEAVRDGITVNLVYDGRAARVTLDQEKVRLIEEYYAKCEREGANQHQIEESQKAVANMEVIIGDPDRLRAVAEDFINHYESRVAEGATVAGKAMFVCSNRYIAYELFGSTDYGFDEASTYEINAEAFENIEAYRLI